MKTLKALRPFAWSAFGLATLAIAISPMFLGDGYSPLSNSISESAAQGVANSWIGRTSLLMSGLGVLAVATIKRQTWSRLVAIPVWVFGSSWILTSVFSTKSWMADAAFNSLESNLHSVFASLMAIIVLPALVLALAKRDTSAINRVWHFALACAATFLPLAGLIWQDFAGVFQRVMFLFTYAWFIRESLDEN